MNEHNQDEHLESSNHGEKQPVEPNINEQENNEDDTMNDQSQIEQQKIVQQMVQAQLLQSAMRRSVNSLWLWGIFALVFRFFDVQELLSIFSTNALALSGTVKIYVFGYIFSLILLVVNLICTLVFTRQLKKQYYNLTLLMGMIILLVVNTIAITVSIISISNGQFDFFLFWPVIYSLLQLYSTFRANSFFKAITRNIPSS